MESLLATKSIEFSVGLVGLYKWLAFEKKGIRHVKAVASMWH